MTSRLREVVRGWRDRLAFSGSVDYWERRYAGGGTSGAGSYGRPAEFKAEWLNHFVEQRELTSVIEFGCGDGNQLALARYPSYLGLDVAPSAITMCRERFVDDKTKSFYLYDPRYFVDHARVFRADVALSLDVLFHLVEDDIFGRYMEHLFAAADSYVVIYAVDEDRPDPAAHVRHRHFTSSVAERFTGWRLTAVVDNPHGGEGGVSSFHVFERSS
jgi:SAM-dependent methyltransferase